MKKSSITLTSVLCLSILNLHAMDAKNQQSEKNKQSEWQFVKEQVVEKAAGHYIAFTTSAGQPVPYPRLTAPLSDDEKDKQARAQVIVEILNRLSEGSEDVISAYADGPVYQANGYQNGEVKVYQSDILGNMPCDDKGVCTLQPSFNKPILGLALSDAVGDKKELFLAALAEADANQSFNMLRLWRYNKSPDKNKNASEAS